MSPASNPSPPQSESAPASAAEKVEDAAAIGTEKQAGSDDKKEGETTSLAVDGGEANGKERVVAVVEKDEDVPNGATGISGGRDDGAGGLASVATEGDDEDPARTKEVSDDVVEKENEEETGLLPEASSVNAVSVVEEEKGRLQLLEQRRQPAGNVTDNDQSKRTNDDDDETAAEPAAEDDSSRPIKRARTAYFIFAEDRRARVTEDLKNSSGSGNSSGGGVAAVAKVLGQLWKQLSDEERAPYHAKAAEERERVQAQVLQRQQQQQQTNKKTSRSTAYAGSKRGGTAADGDDDSPSSPTPRSLADSDLALPLAKVRKICKLDPDVRGLSREALACITKVSELVLAKLGAEAVKVAALQNRRKLLPDDVAVVCQNREQFAFLREDIVDLVRLQHKTKLAAAHDKLSAKKGSTEAAGAASTFVRAPSSSTTTLMGAEEDEDDYGGDVNKMEGVALAATEEGNNDENIDKTKKNKRTKPPKPVPPPLPPASTKPLTSYFAPAGTSASTKSVAVTSSSSSAVGASPET